MKRWILLVPVLAISQLFAQEKIRVSVFNESSGGILVLLNDQSGKPLEKNQINAKEAKNFFVPTITFDRPYYWIVGDSSSDNAQNLKRFMIKMERKGTNGNGTVLKLYRDNLVIDTLEYFREDEGTQLVFYGELKPRVHEAEFMKGTSRKQDVLIYSPTGCTSAWCFKRPVRR